MSYLLRKTSDSRDLTAALDKLRQRFELNTEQVKRVLKGFRKVGISPITIPNSEKAVCKLRSLKDGITLE